MGRTELLFLYEYIIIFLINQMVATETTQPPLMVGKVVWEEEALCLVKRTVLLVEEYDLASLGLIKWQLVL